MGSGTSLSQSVALNSLLTPEEQELYQNAATISKILQGSRTIAMVGLSAESQKASYFVATYLRSAGYRIIPVNPRVKEIFGEPSYPNLSSIPDKVDLVDIFRPAKDCLPIVEEAIACHIPAIWIQLKIVNLEAAEKARAAGLLTVMDLCVKMEHGRYSGGLHEAGMNTEIISAKRQHRFI